MPLEIVAGPEALAAAAAARVATAAAAAIGARGAFHVALSGGRTTRGLHEALAAAAWRGSVDWARVEVWFADERAVPPHHAESNARAVREALLDHVPLAAGHVHRMRGEAADLEAEAEAYASAMPAALDLVVLGMGEDGHVASLFPGSAALAEPRRRVVAVFDAPKPPPRRLSLAPPALVAARGVLVLASGAAKAAAVARALAAEGDVAATPARLVRGRDWIADAAAAGRA